MKNYKSYALLSLFCLEFIKTLLVPPSFVDSTILLVLGSVFSYFEYKNSDKKLKEFQDKLTALEKDFSAVKENVSSIKIIQQVSPNSLGFKR